MLFFLYGQDTFRSRQKLNELKEKFKKEIDPGESSLSVLDGENISLSKINEQISPSSLFARKRMVIIENIFSSKKADIFQQMLDLLQKQNQKSSADNIIIFWDSISSLEKGLTKGKKDLFAILSKEKYAQEFELLSNTKAAAWAKKEIEKKGGKITLQLASELVGLTGNDLWSLHNEIDKLISYKQVNASQTEKKFLNPDIVQADIEEMVIGNFDENIFALTDAISNKNKKLSVKLFEEQVQAGLSEQYIFSMILRQFRILLQIRDALDAGLSSKQIIGRLKLHPFVVQKSINQVRNYSSLFLRRLYSHLLKIDFKNKTGQGDLRTMMDLMIVKL